MSQIEYIIPNTGKRLTVYVEGFHSSCGTMILYKVFLNEVQRSDESNPFEGVTVSEAMIRQAYKELWKKMLYTYHSKSTWVASCPLKGGILTPGNAYYGNMSDDEYACNIQDFCEDLGFIKSTEAYNSNSQNMIGLYTKVLDTHTSKRVWDAAAPARLREQEIRQREHITELRRSQEAQHGDM